MGMNVRLKLRSKFDFLMSGDDVDLHPEETFLRFFLEVQLCLSLFPIVPQMTSKTA